MGSRLGSRLLSWSLCWSPDRRVMLDSAHLFQIILIYKLTFKFSIRRIDVTTAFLKGKVKGLVIVELPEGLSKVQRVERNEVSQLNSALYGLPEAARRFYDLLRTTLKNKTKSHKFGNTRSPKGFIH